MSVIFYWQEMSAPCRWKHILLQVQLVLFASSINIIWKFIKHLSGLNIFTHERALCILSINLLNIANLYNISCYFIIYCMMDQMQTSWDSLTLWIPDNSESVLEEGPLLLTENKLLWCHSSINLVSVKLYLQKFSQLDATLFALNYYYLCIFS